MEPFAFKRPCALLPYCYGAGQQDSSGYSLAKEGWPRHQVNGHVPLKSAARSVSPVGRIIKNGVVRSTSDNRWLEQTTLPCFAYRAHIRSAHARLRPPKEASPLFLNGRSHPPLPRRG